ncbi:MAG: carbohydrate binding family 9 domain-containing protein, partial [Methylotenera sp.]|nr:carbohydrate binding family 9 domain-containing protein [Flavobacterium sp.]
MKYQFLFCFLLLSFVGFSQKKVLQTKFISEKIEIDGKLEEPIWQSAAIASNFIMFQPDNGKPIPENKKTEIRVLYDNDAIYIGALLNDENPEKILKEITQRDNFGTSDLFGVFINGFNDGQQDFQFFVNAADGQADCITTDSNGEDYSWDAVWKSKAVITDKGWVVEMRIPYAALRFSAEKKQTWGLNFFREIRRDRFKYTWNFIDSKLGTFTQQTGVLEGIENIKPPTRLFLLPYSSFYVNANAAQKTYGTLKGGLDLKYGINDAFTLDMILIPDFGQTKYDDQILNLGPFEQQFNENRPFFTEGT